MTAPSAERWTRLADAFEEARALSGDAQDDFVARLRREDPSFANELEGLLRSLESTNEFLEPPAREGAAADLEGARIGDCHIIRP